MQSVSIIGVGRVGGALALALAEAGYSVETLFSRGLSSKSPIIESISPPPVLLDPSHLSKIKQEVVFVTTQDSEIRNVARELKTELSMVPRFIFHTSGSLSSEVLNELKETGAKIGSIHPLTSISDPFIGAKRFEKAFFCIEGDAEAVRVAETIVKDLGGRSFSIETINKPLYHASAVTACGHLVALIDCAVEMLSNCGLSDDSSREILMPLISGTVENLNEQNPADALTGTFARADLETLEKHIISLTETVSPEIFRIYLMLGKRSLMLAQANGIDPMRIEKMRSEIARAEDRLSGTGI